MRLRSSWLFGLAGALFVAALATFMYAMVNWDVTAAIVAVLLGCFGLLFLVLAVAFAASRRAAKKIEFREVSK